MFINPTNLAKPITQIQQPLPPHTVVAGVPKPANQFSVVPRAVTQMAVGAGFALGALWAQPAVAMRTDISETVKPYSLQSEEDKKEIIDIHKDMQIIVYTLTALLLVFLMTKKAVALERSSQLKPDNKI